MDDKILIKEVKKYDFLYNSESDFFNDRKYCKKAWTEISQTLKLPARSCCNKWKNLRHRFVKTYQRSMTKSCEEHKQNKWELFDDLLFLTKYIHKPRDPLENDAIEETSCPLLRSKRRYHNLQTTDEFDVELIEEVKKYSILYDKKHTNYFDKRYRTLIWNNIGEHLNITGEMVKKRWRVLRDHFVRDFNRKQTLEVSTISEKPPIVWELYNNMLFLKDYIETNIIPDPKTCQNGTYTREEEDTFEPVVANVQDVLYRRLINEIKKYKCLLSTSFNVARKRQIAWLKISATLNQPPLVIRRKWRYLRNRFIREYNSPETSQWKLFDDLLFLKDYIKIKNTEPLAIIEESQYEIMNNELQERNMIFVEDNEISTTDFFPKMKKNTFYTKLIKEVKLYEPIYNPMDPNHRNTRFLGLIWHEISKRVEEPAHKCRIRWYTLRDRFIREFLDFKKNSHFDEFSWEFFRDLMFLKDFIEVPRSNSNKKKLHRGCITTIPNTDATESPHFNHGEQINCEQLIFEIRNRPALYANKKMIRDHKEKCMKLWTEISNKINFPVYCCQQKWKGLRRRFILEYRKSTKSKNSQEIRSLWPYYGIMEFLVPYITSKKKKSNLNDIAEEWLYFKDKNFDITNPLEKNEENSKTLNRVELDTETSTDILFLDDSLREEQNNDDVLLTDDTSKSFTAEIIEIESLELPEDFDVLHENEEYNLFLLDNETRLNDFDHKSNEIYNLNKETIDENKIISIQIYENSNGNALRKQTFTEDSVRCKKPEDCSSNQISSAASHHLEFIEQIYNKFLGLSRDEQEETKMFYLNYLHMQIKRKHKDIEPSKEKSFDSN